jgi:hypothetical protein
MGKKIVHVEYPAQDVGSEGNEFSLYQTDENAPMPEGAPGG